MVAFVSSFSAVAESIEIIKVNLGTHINPVARLESVSALKLSRLENFRALKPYDAYGEFSHPKTLKIGVFQSP